MVHITALLALKALYLFVLYNKAKTVIITINDVYLYCSILLFTDLNPERLIFFCNVKVLLCYFYQGKPVHVH